MLLLARELKIRFQNNTRFQPSFHLSSVATFQHRADTEMGGQIDGATRQSAPEVSRCRTAPAHASWPCRARSEGADCQAGTGLMTSSKTKLNSFSPAPRPAARFLLNACRK